MTGAYYVDGFQRSRAYIAVPYPIQSNQDAFWRMIWEHRVKVVVLITGQEKKQGKVRNEPVTM